MRICKCKACGAPIVWIATASGKRMPCDAEEILYVVSANSPRRVVTPNGNVLPCEFVVNPALAEGVGYIPHWATCPQAEKFRKRGGVSDD